MSIFYPDNTASRTALPASGINDSTLLLNVNYNGEKSLSLAELKKTGVNVVNVEQYGAVGDGVTDNTTVFQTAISVAYSGGGVVYVPPGNFAVNTHLYIYGAVSIVGAGDTSVIKQNGNITSPTGGYWINAGIKSYGGVREHWTGSITNVQFTAGSGSSGMRACVFLHNCSGAEVSNNFFNWEAAPAAAQQYLYWSIEGFNNNPWNSVDGSGRSVAIRNNRIVIRQIPNGGEGIGVNFGVDCIITGNYIYGCGDDPIGLHGCSRVVVANNICRTVDGRIIFNNCTEVVCTGNYCTRVPDASGTWTSGGALIYASLELIPNSPAQQNIVISNNILRLPSDIPSTPSMYMIRMVGVRNAIISNNILICDTPAGINGINLEKDSSVAGWTGPSGDIDYTNPGPATAKVRNVIINNNICCGQYPSSINQGGADADFPGAIIVSNNIARSYTWFSWNTRFFNNVTSLGNGVGFQNVAILQDMPTIAEFQFSALTDPSGTGVTQYAKIGGVLQKWKGYLKSAGRITGVVAKSDTAITGGGAIYVKLYRNGIQMASDYSVGSTFDLWQNLYTIANTTFDYNVRSTTTDEDYIEVVLSCSGTVSSTHSGIVRLLGLYDIPNTDCLQYNFNSSGIDTTTDYMNIGTHALLANDRVVFKSDGTLPTGITQGTIYWVLTPSGNNVNISTTSGGSQFDFTNQGSGILNIMKFAVQ